jgi:8-oxo-dGTP pyrophosphatase MutT (NUDIX family)
MKICSLLFLLRDDEILLAMKKRGFGVGRYNGVGGKAEVGESSEQTAIRECQEEITVIPRQLQKVAIHHFEFEDGTPGNEVHTYLSRDWKGQPTETEEMAPHWF